MENKLRMQVPWILSLPLFRLTRVKLVGRVIVEEQKLSTYSRSASFLFYRKTVIRHVGGMSRSFYILDVYVRGSYIC